MQAAGQGLSSHVSSDVSRLPLAGVQGADASQSITDLFQQLGQNLTETFNQINATTTDILVSAINNINPQVSPRASHTGQHSHIRRHGRP